MRLLLGQAGQASSSERFFFDNKVLTTEHPINMRPSHTHETAY